MRRVAVELRAEGKYGTAHVYRSTVNAVLKFSSNDRLEFRQITSEWLKNFEVYLRSRGNSWNTVSTYLRVLRSVYNRAVDSRKADYVPHLFRSVYTGTRSDKKRSLDGENVQVIFNHLSQSAAITPGMKRTHELFILMFMMRGLPFVDLAYLRKGDLHGNVISYRRRKTGRSLSVTLTPEAMILLQRYMDQGDESPYLFPILRSREGTQEAYREYQLALRNFNYQLSFLAQILGIKEGISSYTARHTWATMAYYCEIHPGIISEAMGHSSIVVTETYLKPFHNKKIDEANRQVIEFVRKFSCW